MADDNRRANVGDQKGETVPSRATPRSNTPRSNLSNSSSETLGPVSETQCPAIEVLNHLLAGETIADSLADHVAGCRHCQDALDKLSNDTPLNELRDRIDPSGVLATWLEPTTSGSELGTLAGFLIESQIAVGGMGVIYRGLDERLGRQVAIKVLRRFDHPQAADRFLREIRAVAKLQHDHVVPIYESGLARDGRPYLVMPLIEGETLAHRIRRAPLDPNEAAEIVRQIAVALEAAHSAGLIHRDIKPANIMLDAADGRAKLTDFGLVRVVDEVTLTMANVLAGTPEYMSPEQATGTEKIDSRSDIYSLGVSLYECLTGTVPYRGRPLEILDQHRNGVPVAPIRLNRSVSDSLNTICLKCLAREPERRYQSAKELSDDLHRFSSGLPILAKPATPWTRLALWTQRNRTVAASLGIVIATLTIGTIATTLLWLQSADNARQAQKLASDLSVNQQQLQSALALSESQRARAQQRFDDLRKLANELLFDIYPQVEYLENSLAAREAIITSALQYLDQLHSESSDDLELQAELATAYEKIGELMGAISNTNLGDKRSGLESYLKARELRQAIFESNPQDPSNIQSLANNFYIVARTYFAADMTPEATEAFDHSLELQREAILLNPDSEAALNKLATILIDSANIPSWDGQFDRANEIYNEARHILDQLIAGSPDNPEYKKTITRLLRAISRIHSETGDLDAGETALLEAIEIGNDLIAVFSDDFSVSRSVWISRYLLGELYVKNGIVDKAVDACRSAIEFPKTVLEREPANAFVAGDLANAYFNLARSHRLREDYDSAIREANNALEVMQRLATAHPDDREYQRNLAIYLSEIARSQIEQADYEPAIETTAEVIEILLPLAQSDSASVYTLFDLAFVHRLAARAHHHLGDPAKASTSINQAIHLLTKLRETGSQQVGDELLEALMAEKETYSTN
jgi:eukaryotic-like serine/threonine-protein kinase